MTQGLILPPSAQRHLEQHRKADKQRRIDEFVGVAKSFMGPGGAPSMGGVGGVAPGTPMKTGWTSNLGNAALLQRAAQTYGQRNNVPVAELEQALADQGLSWDQPFSPGRPLEPFAGYRAPARTRSYQVGENVQVTPRHGRVSFETLKAIYNAWDVPQIICQHLINDVRSLDVSWLPADGVKTDVSADIEAAEAFFLCPDRRRPFRTWLAQWLQDVFRWDAGALYIRRNNAGDPIALEVVDGTTVIPLTDYFGRVPMDEDDAGADPGDELDGEMVPAYAQVIMGMPWTWLAAEDLIYQPLNPVPESQYGLAPLEKVMLTGNTDVRFQMHFLEAFTDSSMPAGLMEAPPDMSDPAQLQEWQDVWDALMVGDQAMLRRIRWVPSGTKFTATKNSDFDEKFPLYLMRRACAAYGVVPADLGFTETVNKSSGDSQIDIQFRVGTRPPIRHVEDILSLFAQRDLGLKVKLQIDDGREVEDRVATAQAHSIYIQAGVESPDEVRDEIGKPTDKTQAVSRFIQTRQGITMLEALLGQTKNPIDPETYAPAGKVEYVEPPQPIAPPAKPPAPGEPGPPAAAGASEQAQASDATPAGEKPAVPGGQDAANTNTSPVAKAETAGITAATGIAGVDILGHSTEDEDEDEDDLDEIRKALIDVSLRRWKANARNRLRKGQAPRRFVDPSLPCSLHDAVWARLEHASTRAEVDAAFAELPKARARKAGAPTLADFHRQTDAIVQHYAPLIATALAGLWSEATLKKAWDAAQSASKAVADPPAGPGTSAGPVEQVLSGDEMAAGAQGLRTLLAEMYGDAALQGAHEAAHASGATIVSSLQGVTEQLPGSYWSTWEPGQWSAAAAKVADGRLKDVLDNLNITIDGITSSAIDDIGDAIGRGIYAGDSYQATAKEITAIVGSPTRADLIANTEYGRAMSAASMDEYAASGVEQCSWLAEDSACEECAGNASGSPYKLDDAPTQPAHPRCRCALAPYLP